MTWMQFSLGAITFLGLGGVGFWFFEVYLPKKAQAEVYARGQRPVKQKRNTEPANLA
jgi:hypothetical protein